jgi:hypothetical protein
MLIQTIVADEKMRVIKLEPAASLTTALLASLFVRMMDDADGLEIPVPTYQGVSYCWEHHEIFGGCNAMDNISESRIMSTKC